MDKPPDRQIRRLRLRSSLQETLGKAKKNSRRKTEEVNKTITQTTTMARRHRAGAELEEKRMCK
ncbi:hypothetical protein QJS04_geneDACA000706 [Acorus gramineus]|uniref:Uncharacterized protein n=1 Tax=Acorus gramineus TaxID=55184 RepID=A0AAV9ARQ5_ACOGR|nr:hypothetical protein QJS04_geneDACA000706 [Acorus gramineus]